MFLSSELIVCRSSIFLHFYYMKSSGFFFRFFFGFFSGQKKIQKIQIFFHVSSKNRKKIQKKIQNKIQNKIRIFGGFFQMDAAIIYLKITFQTQFSGTLNTLIHIPTYKVLHMCQKIGKAEFCFAWGAVVRMSRVLTPLVSYQRLLKTVRFGVHFNPFFANLSCIYFV